MEQEYNDYDTQEDDQELIDDDFEMEADEDDPYLNDDEFMDYGDTDDEAIYEQLSRRKSPYSAKFHPANSFTNELVANESGGNYRAFNSDGGGEGAVGKYQFRWTAHKDKIRKFAGDANLSREDFINSPQLQDDFYEKDWIPNYLEKDVKSLRKMNTGLNNSQLYKLVHFRGKQGAMNYLNGTDSNQPESYNMPTSKYIGMQPGGYTPQVLQGKQYTPFKTKFTGQEIPGLNIPPLGESENDGFNFEGIGNTIMKGVDVMNEIGNNAAQGLSQGIDMAEQFTSAQIENQNKRKRMQMLYEDDVNNYNTSSQRINNNPILT